MSGTVRITGKIDVTRPLIGVPVRDRASGRKRAQSCWSDWEIADDILIALGVGAGEAKVTGTDPPGPPDLPDRSPLSQATQYFGHISLAILSPPCRRFASLALHLRDQGADRFARGNVFSGASPHTETGCQAWLNRSAGKSVELGRVGGTAVSWNDSGARTGPHEIGLIAEIAAKNDDDAARRIYRKYRMELFRFGSHVLRDQGLAEEMVQETFIKFCQQARNYDAKRGPVRGWLFTMARSVAYDIARRPSSRPFLPVEDFQLPPQYDSVDEALTVLTVDQALDKLPSIYNDVMRLVRDGFTHSEIAGRLGIPIGTVKSRMAKAADTLRSELASLRGAADAY